VDEDDQDYYAEFLLKNYIVIGSRPGTANYFLVSTYGEKSGFIYEFRHDSRDHSPFIEVANSFPEFIEYLVELDSTKLVAIATGLRFMDSENPTNQWWITEFRRGADSISMRNFSNQYLIKIRCIENRFSSSERSSQYEVKMPTPTSELCSVYDEDVKLLNGETITIDCEINQNRVYLSMQKKSRESYTKSHLFSVESQGPTSGSYRFDEKIFIYYQLVYI